MYTNRRQEFKKKVLLEGILQTQVVRMWMKGSQVAPIASCKDFQVSKQPFLQTTGVIQFKSVCPHYYTKRQW